MSLRDLARVYLEGTTGCVRTTDIDSLEELLVAVATDAQASALKRAGACADEAADAYNMPTPGERLSERSDRGIQARTVRALAFALRGLTPQVSRQ